jgi:hypothetical protein
MRAPAPVARTACIGEEVRCVPSRERAGAA